MALPLHVDFAPFTPPSDLKSLAFPSVGSLTRSPAAHIHIGRFARPLEGAKRASHDGLLFEKGSSTCPSEIEIAYSDIESYLREEGGGADIFIEPLSDLKVALRVDIALQRTRDGVNWSLEILLANCQPNALRSAQIPELSGNRARIKIRCVCPAALATPVRIWANEPRARHAVPPILFGK